MEDQDIDFEHITEVLAEQHMDFAIECKHFLEVDYTPSRIELEDNKCNLGAHYILLEIELEEGK